MAIHVLIFCAQAKKSIEALVGKVEHTHSSSAHSPPIQMLADHLKKIDLNKVHHCFLSLEARRNWPLMLCGKGKIAETIFFPDPKGDRFDRVIQYLISAE